jgi:hypothetical protein
LTPSSPHHRRRSRAIPRGETRLNRHRVESLAVILPVLQFRRGGHRFEYEAARKGPFRPITRYYRSNNCPGNFRHLVWKKRRQWRRLCSYWRDSAHGTGYYIVSNAPLVVNGKRNRRAVTPAPFEGRGPHCQSICDRTQSVRLRMVGNRIVPRA